ncbi:uncharacterized protein LOC124413831 [Diprion similis]|uniref:uncharacterized protein LOC124413831 n=1 Tax=Diprion similis TaxID=362088 RepID=UPI001EF868E9|nr:uncharacterized protein LOC124413831 [Diprion similis]
MNKIIVLLIIGALCHQRTSGRPSHGEKHDHHKSGGCVRRSGDEMRSGEEKTEEYIAMDEDLEVEVSVWEKMYNEMDEDIRKDLENLDLDLKNHIEQEKYRDAEKGVKERHLEEEKHIEDEKREKASEE